MTANTGPSPCTLPCASPVRDRAPPVASAPTRALRTNTTCTTNLATCPQKQALHRGGDAVGLEPRPPGSGSRRRLVPRPVNTLPGCHVPCHFILFSYSFPIHFHSFPFISVHPFIHSRSLYIFRSRTPTLSFSFPPDSCSTPRPLSTSCALALGRSVSLSSAIAT